MDMELNDIRDELHKAYSEYIPEEKIPKFTKEPWKDLLQRLKDSEYTCDEFCFFAVEFLQNKFNPLALLYMNYISSEKVWNEFITFKKNRDKEVDTVIALQIESVSTDIKNDKDINDILLDTDKSINSIVRIDLAYALCAEKREEILDRFKEHALFYSRHSPEFLDYCPNFRTLLKEGIV